MNPDRHIVPLISDYIDGCLAPAVVRQVEEHLARCPPCAWELEQWRAILHLVSCHASMSCPIDCAEAVLQRIEAVSIPADPQISQIGADRRGGPLLFSASSAKSADQATRNPKLRLAWTTAVVAIGMLLGGWRWASVTGTSSLARHEVGGMVGVGRSTPAGRVAYSLVAHPVKAVDVEAPDRLERAFGRSDSLILASDFAEEER